MNLLLANECLMGWEAIMGYVRERRERLLLNARRTLVAQKLKPSSEPN